ncbi:MAG: energy transducer TonB [Acidobacteria bacterium]|nr:MAG: energy transducer TonB [Acidobacteriota bacterium]
MRQTRGDVPSYIKTILIGVVFALGSVSPMLGQEDDTVYKPGDGVSTPRLVKRVYPQYSADALRRKVKGSVTLRCVVDRDGLPTRLEVIKPLDEDLDRAALDALKQWRFAPGEKDGKAVLVQIDVMFAFWTKQ